MKKIACAHVEDIWQWKALEYGIYILLATIPFLVGYKHWFPFGTPKTLFFMGGMCVLTGLMCWGIWNVKQVEFRITWLHGVLGLFLAWLTVAGFLGADPQASFFGGFTQPNSLFLIYLCALYAGIVAFVVRRDSGVFIKAVLVSFLTSIGVALFSYGGNSIIPLSGGGSTIGNSSYAGAYLLVNVCFGIGLVLWYTKVWQKILVCLGVLSIVLSPIFFNIKLLKGSLSLSQALQDPFLFFGYANGAILGLGIAILFIVFLLMSRSSKLSLRIGGGILCILVVMSIVIAGASLVRSGSTLNQQYVETKTENRFVFWDSANSGYVDRPIAGWGTNNYSVIYQKYFTSDMYRADHVRELWVNQPHNVFLEYLSTAGIVGLLLYSGLVGYVCIVFYNLSARLERDMKIFGIVSVAALVGFLVQNLFSFDSVTTYLMFFTLVGVALGLIKGGKVYRFQKESHARLLSGLGIGIVGCVFIALVVLPWRESLAWGRLVSRGDATVPESSFVSLSVVGDVNDTAFAADRFYAVFQREYLTGTPEEKRYLVDMAEFFTQTLSQQMEGNSEVFRGYFVQGKLLNLLGLIKDDDTIRQEAKESLLAARKLNPENPEVYFALAQHALAEGDTQSVITYLRQGIALAPEYREGYKLAQQFLLMYPDAEFTSYLLSQEEKWFIKTQE